MSAIQREYEHRYPGLPSRWLAYCYAVGRDPKAAAEGLTEGASSTREWFASRVERAKAELGITHSGDLSTPEQQTVTDKIWQYALLERPAR